MYKSSLLATIESPCMTNPDQIRYLVYFAAEHGNLRKLESFCEGIDSASLEELLKTSEEEKNALVIAAREGHLDVVKYLVTLGADVTTCGTVEFDGETIFGAPPIWAASAAGHFEVVRFLVEDAGADLNQTTRTNSTPLRGACYDGHLEIVKYLVDHGADIEIANRHGHTPLMIASYRQKKEVVEYLLSRGANARAASRKGNTALHDAVEANSLEICEVLLQAGAVLADDEYNVCPLMSAAMLGFTDIVELLLIQASSQRKKRDVLKILGATYVDRKNDSSGAKDCWKKALSLDLGNEIDDELAAAASRSLSVPAIYEGRELENLDDLEYITRQHDQHMIRMQALIMRERILGGAHPEVHYYLKYRGALYSEIGMNTRCFTLWMHALELQQQYNTPLHQQTMQTFLGFQDTFAMILTEPMDNFPHAPVIITKEQIEAVFEKAVDELQKLVEWGDKPLFEECSGEDHEHNIQEEKENLIVLILRLLYLSSLTALSPQELQKFLGYEDQPQSKLIPKLKSVEPRVDLQRFLFLSHQANLRPLHLACSSTPTLNQQTGYLEIFIFPKLYLIESLVWAGASLSDQDEDLNTPLHCLLLSDEHTYTLSPMVRYLLEHGAPIHARNAKKQTCLRLVTQRGACLRINTAKYISLFGAAANTIIKENLPYEESIATHLKNTMKLY